MRIQSSQSPRRTNRYVKRQQTIVKQVSFELVEEVIEAEVELQLLNASLTKINEDILALTAEQQRLQQLITELTQLTQEGT